MILSRCIVACARGVLRAHYGTMVIGTWAFSMEHKMQKRFVKSIDVETEAVAEDIVRKVCGKDHKEVGLVGNLAKEGLRDVGLSQRWFRWRAVNSKPKPSKSGPATHQAIHLMGLANPRSQGIMHQA